MVRKYTHCKSRAFKNSFLTASFTLKQYVQSSQVGAIYTFLLKSGNPLPMFYMNSVMSNQAEQQKSLLLVSHNTEKNT